MLVSVVRGCIQEGTQNFGHLVHETCPRNCVWSVFKFYKKQTKSENHETCWDAVISYVEAMIKISEDFVHVVTYDAYKPEHLYMWYHSIKLLKNIFRAPIDFLGMIKNIFRAPINFFDSTPSSRILNRVSTSILPPSLQFSFSVFQASTDQSTVDIDIPYRLAGLIFALIQLLSIIFIMSQIAWPILFLFIVIISISTCYQVNLHALLMTFADLRHIKWVIH